MSAKNDVTGDAIKSRPNNKKYRDNWDKIFAKKKDKKENDENKSGV